MRSYLKYISLSIVIGAGLACTSSNQLSASLDPNSSNGTSSVSTPTPIVNSDAGLNTGLSNSLTCSNSACYGNGAKYIPTTSGGTPLWILEFDNWDLSKGSGTMTSNYNPASGVTWTINYTGENSVYDAYGYPDAVNGYPFIKYGGDAFVLGPAKQGPIFPILLSSMSSLVVEVNYALKCTTCSKAMDAMFDLWLVPTPTYTITSTQNISQEVSIFDYNTFAGCQASSQITSTYNQTIMVNGVATPVTWNICVPKTPLGHQTQVVISSTANPDLSGYISGDISFDQMPLLNAVAKLSGTTGYYLSGHEIGTEWAGNGSTVNFTFDITKYQIIQTLNTSQ